MVQINLPENSKVKKGKYFKDKTGSKNLIKVNNTNIVDLSLLNQGIYIIKIQNNGATSTFKIIKQ